MTKKKTRIILMGLKTEEIFAKKSEEKNFNGNTISALEYD
jgi:hypothetical protein